MPINPDLGPTPTISSLLSETTAVEAVRGLVVKEAQPQYKHVVRSLIDHLGLEDSKKTTPAEGVAARLLIKLADTQIQLKAMTGDISVAEAKRQLFQVQPGETPTATFSRILNFVIENNDLLK